MKKLFAVALALVLSVGIFAGCNASGTSSSAPVSTSAPAASSSASPSDDPTQMTAEITWWAFPTFGQENADDPAGTYEQKIIEAFNEKYPNIKVNLETIDFTSGPDAITAAIEGNAAPDVLFDAPGRIIEYGKNGKLVSLDDLFTDEFVKDVNNDALVNACKGPSAPLRSIWSSIRSSGKKPALLSLSTRRATAPGLLRTLKKR